MDIFSPLLSIAPEYFPLLCNQYFRTSLRGDYESLERAPIDAQIAWKWAKPVIDKDEPHELRVLFDPNSNRPNCVGACRKIEKELKKTVRGCSCFYIESTRKPVELLSEDCSLIFHDRIRVINPFRCIVLITTMLHHIWRKNRRLVGHIMRLLPQILRSLIIIQSRIYEARRVLRENHITWFITPNEQSGISSVFLVAARLEGIKVGQFLHGMPTRLYTPSFSDVFWIWGPVTARMLQCKRHDSYSEIIETGSLEFSGEPAVIQKEEISGQEIGKYRLLILSQLIGDDLWKTTAFSKAMETMALAMSELDEWHVVIRIHPQADRYIKEKLEHLFAEVGCAYSYSSTEALDQDIAESDFVCTASSSGIIEAIIQKKPLCLVWNEELEKIHGDSFLPREMVTRTVDELISMVSATKSLSNELCQSAITELMGSVEASRLVCQNIISNAPLRTLSKS